MVFFMIVNLLLLLLDTSDAQTCLKPGPIEHAVLKPTYRDTEEFNDGAMIAYDCNLGYNIEGTSRERTCDSGIWSKIRFSCTLRTCQYVERPENGRRLDWNKGVGEFTHFACNIGYKLKGPTKMLCLMNSKWMPSNSPICEPILCPELGSIQYGRVSHTSGGMRNAYGSETVYKCNSGYLVVNTIVNQVTRRCQDDGSWSGEEPICDVPRCEKIQPFYGGKVTYLGGRKRWTQVFYICRDSYSSFPADVDLSECSDDLEWIPPPPQCKKKSKAKIPKHGYKSRGNKILLHSDSYTLRCKTEHELYSGRFLDQSSMKITNINGTLTPEVPTCEEERCDTADLNEAKVTNEDGTRAWTKVLSQTYVHVSCNDRFEFYSTKDQSVEIRCLKGKFKSAPTCREKRCLFSGYPDNADIVHRHSDNSLFAPNERIHPGEKIKASCRNDDYELYVDSTNAYLDEFTALCRYGQFDVRKESFPICLEKRCHFTPMSNACFWKNDDDSHNCEQRMFIIQSGTSVNLRCKPGYSLYRSEDGTSEKVTHNPTLVCSKGNYFAGYKCIPEHTIDQLTDFADMTLGKVGDIIDQSTCRFNVFGYSPFGSCKDPCIIPEVQNGFAKLKYSGDKVTGKVPHDNMITIQCDAHYKRSKHITSTCAFGEWKNEDWPQCTPDPCELTFQDGVIFWKDSKLLSGNEGTKIVLADGTTVHLRCEDGYLLKDKTSGRQIYIDNERKSSTCNLGRWTHNYACDEAPCTIPVVVHSTLQSKAVKTYNNKEKATFICDDGFHFKQTLSSKVIRHESTCRLGNWTSIPGQCKPDSCNLTLKPGSKYFSNVTNDEFTTAGLKAHDTKIIIECLENYDLFDNNKNIIHDKDFDAVAVCDHGKWRNTYYCNKQCVTFNVTHGRLWRGDEPVTSSENITHGDQLSVECDSDTNLTDTITCDNGTWKNIATNHNATVHMDATEIIISGCKLSGNASFTYTDEDNIDVAPGTMIANGTSLSVACRTIDMYALYTEEPDYNTDDVVITCIDHRMSKPEIECPEFVPNNMCMELEHGNVKKMFIYYEVSCNTGYSLNRLLPDKPQCDCIGGVLKCGYGNQEPNCSPDHCVIPSDIDTRLSVTNRNRVSLSSDSTVSNGEYVVFNCSKVNEQKYEPLNRRFKCKNGQWLEDEADEGWKFGNDGKIPNCREAICEPACENRGVCHKDDKCKCKHLTTGERCETVLCALECNENGGQCIRPGVCGNCPVGQRGNNCAVYGCKIPSSAAAHSPRRVYANGETIPSSEFTCPDKHMLSSSDGMECLEDGIWSHIITCVKEATYLIRVQTSKASFSGTSANVYIYLNGEEGSTNKINLIGSFTRGELVETRKSEKDIRPITSVRIGHDGSGHFDDWKLEFVSVYVEDVDEYYVFRQQRARWVNKDNDLTLHRRNAFNEACMNTFGDRLTWHPKWNRVDYKHLGKMLSERECKQRCTEQIQQCKAVYHSMKEKLCYGFSTVDVRYFNVGNEPRSRGFFIKNCIKE